MGLQSALTTALTGLTAAEAQIDVVGNNLANSQTVGFKQSTALFATQFLQTQSLGSAPTGNTGGTNPRQTGLGTQVASISPDFTQGTIEVSSSPSDLAIQGDGFFMVEAGQGERFFTRNGVFKTNSANELVTTSGARLLGFGVDESFNIQTTQLQPLQIPLGGASVAQATQNVTLEGTLTPTGEIANTAEVVESATLGDSATLQPDTTGVAVSVGPVPAAAASGTAAVTNNTGAGALVPGTTYEYRFSFTDDSGSESDPSSSTDLVSVTIGAGDDSASLSSLPLPPGGPAFEYTLVNVYRREVGAVAGSDQDTFKQVGANIAYNAASFVDDGTTVLATAPSIDEATIDGNYTYMITYALAGTEESRPITLPGTPIAVQNGRVQIRNVPTPPVPGATDSFPAYNKVRVYRNLRNDASSFYLVKELNPGESFTDNVADTTIAPAAGAALGPGQAILDFDGPRVDFNTVLTDVIRFNGNSSNVGYESVFDLGELTFAAKKGGAQLADKTFEVAATTTIGDLLVFMEDAMGIQREQDDPQNPIPKSLNVIPGETSDLSPGVTINNGKIRFVSNNGTANALEIGLSSFSIRKSDGTNTSPNMEFGSIQTAVGESTGGDFLAFDSLGVPINVRLTAILESRSSNATTYRWFADSANNDPLSGSEIAVGTGLVSFDGEGNFISTTNSRVSIDRRNIPSASPLEFNLDFTGVSGLAEDSSSLAATRQDGFAAGKLTSFSIGEDGIISGAFTNGVSRSLGQVRLARFANPSGLEQRGQNLYSLGVNSGLPVEGNPGGNGIGQVIAGAVELSNTDIGQNLIDLVLASTQYRGNTRVITTAQQMLDELLNLR